MHLIFKEPPSFYSSTITWYLEVYDFKFNIICVEFDKTYFKEHCKLTSIFLIYSSYDTNISAHVPDVCMFSKANACEGYGLRIMLL